MMMISIPLDELLERRLRELAEASGRSSPDLCREAVEDYLRKHDRPVPRTDSDPYAPLRAMIGMVKTGPVDSSIHHDYRPGDEP